jgi:hypothetical protein
MGITSKETDDKLFKRAKRRVIMKKTIKWHMIIYLIVNVLLCVIYYLTTPDSYFWPIWSIIGWGTGLIMHVIILKLVLSSTRDKRDLIEKEYQMLQKDLEQNSDKE